ncbi:alpha/beta-hydrolase [Coniochaeta ligniaria NRRL 30616]|uniref:Alpha/beta-hydrolase n=1 Tax=Coniochaeta ligniaria NRRL 30616 TaxID=1408157 RepID=A0A1J7ITU5_9PEZI|nr:alpha/beta-hydrolase [Coniochaeta ligniaria NRRL 30616]
MAITTTQLYEIHDFSFQDGTTLSSVRLAYLDLNPKASKTALVITCFRGRLKSTLTFANGALRDHRVIVVALFGNGESSSPSNTPDFPSAIDYRDCVRAQHKLLTSHLNIPSLDVVMGFSMGGQCTYYWTLMYPDLVRNAIIICSSARTSRHNHQFLEGPKAALQNAVDYVNRDRAAASPPGSISRGVRAFGKAYSAWLTSAEWFDREAYKSLGYRTLRDWDRDVTGTNYVGWDPDDLLAMVRMWQGGDVTALIDGGGDDDEEQSLKRALSQIKTRVLLMPCRTDQYFSWEASRREARCIPAATLKVIPSIWGHLAGAGSNKADTEWMDRAIAEFLARCGRS